MFWIPLAAGAALGLAKQAEASSQAKDAQRRQAEINRWAPWTGYYDRAQVVHPSLWGNVAQGATAGAMLGQGGMFDSMGAAAASPEAMRMGQVAPKSTYGIYK